MRHLERSVPPKSAQPFTMVWNWRSFKANCGFETARQQAGRFVARYPATVLPGNRSFVGFSLYGDQWHFFAALAAVPPSGRDPLGLRNEYERSMLAHDFTAAERTLSDPRLTVIVDRSESSPIRSRCIKGDGGISSGQVRNRAAVCRCAPRFGGT